PKIILFTFPTRRSSDLREDHTATHLEYEDFGPEDAKRLIDTFNDNKLGLSLGAFENMIGGDEQERVKNQNHLLKLIRIAHLLGRSEEHTSELQSREKLV